MPIFYYEISSLKMHAIKSIAGCSYGYISEAPPEVFLRKGVLKICIKFIGEKTHAEFFFIFTKINLY